MRDNNAGSSCHDTFQGILDQGFGFAIQVAGGFVQDQDARVFEDHTRQGDALFFAAAQAVAALAHDRVIALGQVHDEVWMFAARAAGSISACVASILA